MNAGVCFSVISTASATRADAIPRLRHFILDLAVRGKLVEQNRKDEPASELLKRIQNEKMRRIRDGALGKERAQTPVLEAEVPFAVPTNWSWTRIGICSLATDYGTSVKSDHLQNGVPVLTMGNIQGGKVVLDERKKVSPKIEDLPRLFLSRLDLLYNRTNSAELVGKTGIYLGENNAYTFASYLIRIRFIEELTNPLYINFAMNARYFRETQILPELKQQCGQANVNGSKLRNMIIPIPPLAEQNRIVAKIEELMGLCDQLEASQGERNSRRGRLKQAVHHHINTSASDEDFRNHARFYITQVASLTSDAEAIHVLRQTILSLAVRGRLVGQDPTEQPADELMREIQAERKRSAQDRQRALPLPPIDPSEAPFELPAGWAWARFSELGFLEGANQNIGPETIPLSLRAGHIY